MEKFREPRASITFSARKGSAFKKVFRMVRFTLFCFFLSLIQVMALDSYSQQTRISLNQHDQRLEEVLKTIEDKSEFFFLYNRDLINVNQKVTINASNQTINGILDELLKGTDISYSVVNRQIILSNLEGISGMTAQQQKSISGKVNDSFGGSLPGVSVVVKGTTTGVITDMDGKYILSKVPENATLQFSFVGMKTAEIIVGSKTIINVILAEETVGIEEVVAIGYQTQRKVDLTGSVSIVNIDEISGVPSVNPMQRLQGRVPGLYIESNGSPAGNTAKILIRGLNTLGDNSPLYIIDGVPTKNSNTISLLDPNSIASIQVLKDASASSIYGSRASNGVIIITTKEGKQRFSVEFNTNIGVQNYSLLNTVDMCNTMERGEVLWRASINDGTDPTKNSALYNYQWHKDDKGNAVLDKVIPVEWIGGNSSDKTRAQVPGTDWQDVAYRNAVQVNTSLTISSNTDKSSALLGINYMDNQGIMEYTDYNKLSVRINTNHSFFDGKLKIGENLQLAKSIETPTGTDLGGSGMQALAVTLQPILPVYTEDGKWAGPIGSGFSDRNNVLHMLHIHRDNKRNNLLVFGNVYAELKLMKNLIFRTSLGTEYSDSYNWWFEEKYQEGFLKRNVNYLDVTQSHSINWSWSNTLNYDLTLGNNKLAILAGVEANKTNYISLGAHKEDFALQDVAYRYLDAGTGASTTSGSRTGYQLLSYFGKVNYAFKEKYLASITLRYDGSSRFGLENQYGLFPALTAGWRINNEDFFNIPQISNLKIRAGIGRVGNQEIGNNARFGLYQTNYGTQSGVRNIGTAYDINGAGSGTLPSGYVATQNENAKLRWESTDELNIGVDFGLLNEKIIGSFDYFSRETNDILIKPPYPGVVGEGGSRWENGATTQSNGFEFILGYRNKKGQLSYNITGSISASYDKITKLPEAVIRAYPGNIEKTIIGHSQSSIFGYVTDGIFQNQEEVNSYAVQPGKGIGRIRFKDLNGDGKIDPLDQDWLGTTLPDFEYGISGDFGYKNFSLSIFFQGVSGKTVNDAQKAILTLSQVQGGMNFGRATLQGWTPNNTNTDIPAQSLINSNNETRVSDYMNVNGSYLKLRTLQLSYQIPSKIIQKIKLNELRVYLLGDNIFMIKDTKGKNRFFGTDPETANWEYPRPTSLSLGINMVF